MPSKGGNLARYRLLWAILQWILGSISRYMRGHEAVPSVNDVKITCICAVNYLKTQIAEHGSGQKVGSAT